MPFVSPLAALGPPLPPIHPFAAHDNVDDDDNTLSQHMRGKERAYNLLGIVSPPPLPFSRRRTQLFLSNVSFFFPLCSSHTLSLSFRHSPAREFFPPQSLCFFSIFRIIARITQLGCLLLLLLLTPLACSLAHPVHAYVWDSAGNSRAKEYVPGYAEVLHHCAFAAAAGVLVVAVHLHFVGGAFGVRVAAAGVAAHVLVVFADLPDNVVKGVVHVDA